MSYDQFVVSPQVHTWPLKLAFSKEELEQTHSRRHAEVIEADFFLEFPPRLSQLKGKALKILEC